MLAIQLFSSRTFLVDHGQQAVCWVGDDGGGDTGDHAGRQGHPHLGHVAHLVGLGADGVADLLRGVTLVQSNRIERKS